MAFCKQGLKFNMLELYIIRHGKTVWNQENRLQGSTDIELLEESRKLAAEAAVRYENIHFDKVYTSPLKRAYETGCILKGNRNIPVQKDERLRELSFGILEGKTYEESGIIHSGFQYFFTEPWLYVPAEKGETLEHLFERTGDFIKNEIEVQYTNNKDLRFIIAAHGAVNAALCAGLRKEGVKEFWGKGLQKNLEAAVFSFDGNGWTEK